MRKLVCILTIAALVLIGTAVAAPVLPDEFYGSVYLNGNPAPAGTLIIAKVNDAPRGEITTTVAGAYGGPGNFDPRLYVNITEAEINSGGATIVFFVDGVQAFQTIKSGNSGKLDLFANDKAFATGTTPTAGSSSSGGSSVSSSSGTTSGGSIVSGSGSMTGTTSGNTGNGASVTTTPTTASRSSIYYKIDAPDTTPAVTTPVTTAVIPSQVVTTLPTTKKAGMNTFSTLTLIVGLLAILGIMGNTICPGKRR
jgi:hypothetical protein